MFHQHNQFPSGLFRKIRWIILKAHLTLTKEKACHSLDRILSQIMGMITMMSSLAILAVALMMPLLSIAVDIHQVRQLAAKNNVSCILVFGDSSVDPGNNNHLATTMKGNFPPYGKDFFNGHPSGRFSNGRLATDFIGKFISLY